MECQGMRRQEGKRVPRYPTLYRQGINVDCPEDWYLVNIKAADYGAISEIAKYVAKGDEIVSAGPGHVVTYLMARRGKRMLQGFGSMYKVMLLDDEDQEDEEDRYGAPPGQGRGGFQAIKSGGGGVFTTDFAPGNYALVCFVEEPNTGAPHFALGMIHEFTVQ
jgi:hypothetical protein